MNNRYIIVLIILITGLVMLDQSQPPRQSGDIDPATFKERLNEDPGVIIDVRTPKEHLAGHLKSTAHQFDFLSGEFDNRLETLDRNETYYLYCRTGNRSGQAMEKMREAGFKKVYNVGGYEDLISSGFSSNE